MKNDNLSHYINDLIYETRIKTGILDLINPQDVTNLLATEGSLQEKDVCFYDLGGRCVYSYTWDEFNELSELPPIITNSIVDTSYFSWSYTLDEIKKQKNHCKVGLIYYLESTQEYIINVPNDNFYVTYTGNLSSGSVAFGINWGDGVTNKTKSHVYEKSGVYHVRVYGYTTNGSHGISPRDIVSEFHATNFDYDLRQYPCVRRFSMGKTSIRNTTKGYVLQGRYLPCVTYSMSSFNYCDTNMISWLKAKQIICATTSGGSIPQGNFAKLPNIESICIPEYTYTIADGCFKQCPKLKKIWFPSTLTAISLDLEGSENVEVLDFKVSAAIPSAEKLSNIPTGCKIVIPDTLYDNWIIASNWSTYADRIVKASEYTE